MSNDVSLSLATAWSRVRQEVLSEREAERKPIGRRAERFFGFIEGRLRLNLPEWWEDQMREGQVFQNHSNFGNDSARQLWSESNGRLYNGVDDIISERDMVVLRKGKQSVSFERRQIRDFADETEDQSGTVLYDIAATVEDSLAYICICGSLVPRELHCLDRKSGKITWTATVDGGAIPDRGYSGGGHGHYCELFTNDKSVIVFGGNDMAMYVEVFAKANGKPQVRFATSYLDCCDDNK